MKSKQIEVVIRHFENITAAAALAAVFFLALFKVANYDIWWILADGRYILEHRTVPFVDVFRHVSIAQEYPWVNHLYLTGTLLYLVYLVGSFEGLIIFKAFIVTATFYLLYLSLRTIKKEAYFFISLLLALTAFAVRFRMVIRPDVFSFLFFVSIYHIVSLHKSGRKAPLYLLPPIHLLWVNMHAGYFAGLVLLWTIIAIELFKYFLFKLRGYNLAGRIELASIKKLFFYATASSFAVLISPFGYKMVLHFKGFMVSHGAISTGTGTARVGEWQPLALTHFKGLGICFTSEYGIIIALLLLSMILTLKKIDVTDLVLSAGFFYASTISIRFIPFAVFVMTPAIVRNYSALATIYNARPFINSMRGLLTAAALTGCILGVLGLGVPPNFKFGVGVPEGRYPEDAVSFIKENNIDGNFFNSYGIGGYLIWRFYPERRVFMDGRVLSNIDDYYRMVDSPEGWKELQSKYNFDVIVIENDRKDFLYHIFSNPDWSLVFFDDRALVFLKNIDKYGDIIQKNRYAIARPTFLDFGYLDHYLQEPEKMIVAQKEFNRNLLSTRFNSEARLAIAYLYFNSGKRYYDAALTQIQEALKVAPNLAMAHSALGWLYMQKGKEEEGIKELKRAIQLDPADLLAKDLLAKEKAKGRH